MGSRQKALGRDPSLRHFIFTRMKNEKGEPVLFSLEENASTGFRWDVESSTNECTVVLKHCGGDRGATCGAPGRLEVAVTSLVRTPVCVEFRYRRPWEKDVEPWKTLRLVVKSTEEEQKGGGGDAGNLVKYHNE